MTSQNNPLRSPRSPRVSRLLSRAPAMLMSWQGNPAVRTSTEQRLWAPQWCTSSNCCAWGNRSASTARLMGLSSTCQALRYPAFSNPTSNPPMPANKLPRVGWGIQELVVLDARGTLGGGSGAFRWLSVRQRGHLICNSVKPLAAASLRQQWPQRMSCMQSSLMGHGFSRCSFFHSRSAARLAVLSVAYSQRTRFGLRWSPVVTGFCTPFFWSR